MVWLQRIWLAVQWILALVGLAAVVVGALLAVPLVQPPELAWIRAGATAIDQSGMPGPSRLMARDGTWLDYRLYPAADGSTGNIAIVIHGSAGHSTGVNEIAKRLAAENIVAVAPDMRGHGGSGTRGDIAYLGQLDDDLADLLTLLRRQYPEARVGLLGFSAGGGFALRVAAGKLAGDFDRLVLLSPYLGYDAPTSRPDEGAAGWASVDLPRLMALNTLRRLGLVCCESLPVIAFAVAPHSEKYVTAQYSYRLIANFTAPSDRDAAFRALKMPTAIIAGAEDELMYADKYADVVRGITPAVAVKILPGLGHMDMLHAPAALDAIAAAFKGE